MWIQSSIFALFLCQLMSTPLASGSPLLDADSGLRFGANSPWYVTSAVQLGLHSIDRPSGELDLSSIGQGFYFALGRPVMPILSLETALDFWFTDEEDENPVDHALLHDFHFSGISLGVNAIFHLPGVQGPYAKIGRHCWGASVYDTLDIWDGSGCSNLFGGGAYFGPSGHGYFMELSRIRYERVDSWFMTAGLRF